MASLETESKKKGSALGRGLASLIPDAAGTGPTPKKEFFFCDIEKIVPNTYQPRKIFEKEALEELVESIKAHGIIQPLVVRKSHGHYELVAGERRWRAAQKAGLKQVPVVVKEVAGDGAALEMAIIENVQRAELNCIEEAIAYQQLVDEFQLTHEDVAKRVGKSRASIANTIRLLKLPSAVREDISAGKLSMGHARALLALDLTEDQLKAREQIIKKKMSVRDAEKLVNRLIKEAKKEATEESKPEETAKADSHPDANIQAVEDNLRRHYGTKVKINGKDSGVIEFHFGTKEDLTRLSEALLWNFNN